LFRFVSVYSVFSVLPPVPSGLSVSSISVISVWKTSVGPSYDWRVPKNKPTITTVAAEAGVAVSTVSRYLNGHYVSRSVRARLAEVIETLGYSRSWTARNLSLGRKGCIGVAVDSTEDPWFTQLLTGIEEELATRDASLMLASLELRGNYDVRTVQDWIRGRRIDGLIVPKSSRRDRALLEAAVDVQLPTVQVAPHEILRTAAVIRGDNLTAGRTVASHLASLGHRVVGFAGGPRYSLDSQHRLRGLRDELRRRGVALHARSTAFCGSYQAEAGARFAQKLLERPLDVTAMVFGNDALALGFMRVAQQRGVRMPRDLSIVGFDNIAAGALAWPGLTTVAQPMREMGRDACRYLFEAGSHRRPPSVEYQMELVMRESTGPPRSNVTT
jgi:LacI family transcriptional regulator